MQLRCRSYCEDGGSDLNQVPQKRPVILPATRRSRGKYFIYTLSLAIGAPGKSLSILLNGGVMNLLNHMQDFSGFCKQHES